MFTEHVVEQPRADLRPPDEPHGCAPGCSVAAVTTRTTTSHGAGTTGDGLLYSVLNPLLAEYHSYFNPDDPL